MPAPQGVRLKNHQHVCPVLKIAGKPYQQELILFPEGRTFHRTLQYDDLLTQQRIFSDKFGPRAEDIGEDAWCLRNRFRSQPIQNHLAKRNEHKPAEPFNIPSRDKPSKQLSNGLILLSR